MRDRRGRDGLDVLVNMSQMTVSQMTATSTEESRQQRLHWLAEHVINWSGIPAVHIRPTVFLDNPFFTVLAARSIRETGRLALPFGSGRTSPVAATDVADVVTTVLRSPDDHLGAVYELTGPAALDIDGLAEQYAKALDRPAHGFLSNTTPNSLPTSARFSAMTRRTKRHRDTAVRIGM